MFGGKDIAAIFRRELLSIESQFQRSVVRLQHYVGSDDFALQFGMFALMAWILMSVHVPPGPAVEAAILHVRDVVGDQVVSQSVTLVD